MGSYSRRKQLQRLDSNSGNSSLHNHLDNPRSNAKYPSPQIQNELLDIAVQQILSRIVANCRKAGCYAFIADESADIAVKEQISVCVRFVEKENNGKHYVHEDFLSFINADKGTNAEALTTKFLEALNNLGLPLDEMRAQGYNGASVMSGHVNAVQARIKQQNRKAVSPCAKPLRCTLFKTTAYQEYHGYSSRSCLGFQVFSQKGVRFGRTAHEQCREEMGRQSKLKVLCETPWASRTDSLNVFVTSFQVSSLSIIQRTFQSFKHPQL